MGILYSYSTKGQVFLENLNGKVEKEKAREREKKREKKIRKSTSNKRDAQFNWFILSTNVLSEYSVYKKRIELSKKVKAFS